MAKKCFKYRGNTYTSEELFQKIRRNAEQFAKRHKISGSDMGGANFSIQSNQQTPLPHKNTIPNKTFKDVMDILASQGLESAENALKTSSWYSNVSDTRKQEINRQGVVVTMQNESRKIIENAKVAQKNAVASERTKSDEKVKAVKKDYKNKIQEMRDKFDDRIKKIKESNKDAKQKIRDRKSAVREMVADVKSFLASNKIDGLATPTEINRLIKVASELSQRRDLSKALTEFERLYNDIQAKAEDRRLKDENRTLSDTEFESLETVVTDQLSQGVSQADIEQSVKAMDLPFSKAGTLSDAVKSEIEKIKNRYETNQLTPEQKLEKSREAERRSNEVLKNKNKNWRRDVKRKLITNFTDRQFLAKYLSAKLGMINTYNRIIVASGASSAANLQFEQARDKIFKGLAIEERRNLDILINRRRIVAIEENRKKRGLAPINNTDGFSLESSKEAIEAMRANIGDAAFDKLNERTDAYFGEFKSILDAMLKNGIISDAQHDAMINVDYQPRMFIEHLLDADGRLMDDESDRFANGSGGLKKDMLQGLSDGSIGDQIMNAEWILRLALASRNRQMAQNEINRTFMTRDFPESQTKYDDIKSKTEPLTKEEKRFVKYFEELSAKVKDNPVTGINKNGNPEYKFDKTPSGFKKAYYFQDGVRHEFFMEAELHKQFHDAAKGELTQATKEAIAKGSGSRVIKFFATGANPAFPIVNTPRDFLQTITFSKEYSDFMPKSTVQLIKDATNGIKELIKNDLGKESLYDKYIQYGGGMDFLHTQGMVKRDNIVMEAAERVISPAFRDKALTGWNSLTLKKLSRYSEVMFRLAIFHRSLTNQLKEFNKVNGTNYTDIEQIPDTESQFKEDMYIAAASSARSIMDFNQGGTVTKDMESLIPYINAATQGTRVAVDAFTQRPKETAVRMLQAGALMASTGIGLSFALFAMFDDDDEDDRTTSEKILWAYEGISKYQRINSINIVTPMKTDKGEYYVLKIAKTQFLTPITYYMEESIMNTIRYFNDKPLEPQKNILKNTIWAFNNNVTPVNTQLGSNPLSSGTWMEIAKDNLIKNPLGKAAMTYATGYDFFRDQPLDKGSMGKDMPLQLEGIKNDKVEDFYKAYGELVNQSPIRTKAAVESFVTSPDTNPWVGLIYGGAEVIASDKTKSEVFGKYGENTVKSMVKRLKSETSEFSRMLKRREEQKDAIEAVIIKEEKEKAAIDIMARKMLKNEMTVEEAEKQFKAMKMDTDKSERMFKRLSEKVKKPDANPQVLDIKYSTNDPVVKAYLINTYFPELDEKTFNMLDENEIWSKAVKEEYFKLKADGK